MTKNHNYYLDLAFQLADINLGKTSLNPSVGSIIVKKDTVISSGITSIGGRPHSEFNALNKIKNCSGATLYTTLEPCTHYGKTAPCVDIIIRKRIKKVYYAFNDPDTRVFKKAKKILNAKRIKAKLIKNKKYENFYKAYFINKKFNMPFITAKIALSKDYFTINKKKRWITNSMSRRIVHLFRSKNDSILSTSKSINFDNSLLNCRIDGLNRFKPDLFIVDFNLKLKKNLLLNNLIKKRRTYLITNKKNQKKARIYRNLGYKLIFVNSLIHKEDFISLYKKIYSLGYSSVFIESGLTFINTLIHNKLIHNLYIFKSDNKLGRHGTNNTSLKYIKKKSLKLIKINLKNDKLFKKEFHSV
tara:strand:- start:12 stop:1085 length:1074 start_codon:yes stop_codon:yes gene_type:complete